MREEWRAYVAFAGLAAVLVTLALVLPGPPKPASETEAPVVQLPVARPASSDYLATVGAPAPGKGPLILQGPAISKDAIAFAYGGEIWVVAREGGEARRLVTGQLRNRHPIFSPDGSLVVFTGVYDDNADVYVVPFAGGEPRRLTFYPGPDEAVGFTPDGKGVVFQSMRDTPRDLPKLFTVPLTGGLPDELPLPSGIQASYSPDGKKLAYVPYMRWQPGWKRYRGGQTTPVWILDLADSHVVKVPRENSNDGTPMWVGGTIYFLSDRGGPMALFAYDVAGGGVREVTRDPNGFDIRSASAGPGAIVYERLGKIVVVDLASGTPHDVPVTIAADLPQVRARLKKVDKEVRHPALSPHAKRVLFEAHGDILSVPAEKGDARNLTRSPGVADRFPSWSPDGKWIAWLSDESGEYALHLESPDGLGPVRTVALGTPPSFFYSPVWSPDSKHIALTDKRLNIWLVEVDKGTMARVDADLFDTPLSALDPTWSFDSKWLAYTKQLPNHLRAAFVYSMDDKKTHQLTDGRSDATSPRFDRSGKYLWFLASTNAGLSPGWLDMSSMGRAASSSVYAIVLRKGVKSPAAPQSDEEGDKTRPGGEDGDDGKAGKEGGPPGGGADKDKEKEKDRKKEAAEVHIDFEGLDQRIVAMPIDRANYRGLEVGAEGSLFLEEQPIALDDEDYSEFDDEGVPFAVLKYDAKTRKTEKFLEKVDGEGGRGEYGATADTFLVSDDGKKVLYAEEHKWFLVSSDKPPKGGDGALKEAQGLEVWIDPRAEFRQMFHETWRIERDFLYDPNAHGLDLAAAEKAYAPFLDGIAGREDLSALFEEMLSNLTLGHVFVRGGAVPVEENARVGLLGADWAVDRGRYKFARILSGENWNPKLKAPLTQPGVDVKVGDYLLAVNGQDVRASDDVHRVFLGTAGKQTVLTIAATPNAASGRQVTVVPVASDGGLRLRTWMEENRKKVDELSGGRVGYVYIPDTAAGGFANFNRYYFSQVGKDAVVLDERFNHGGQIADYIVDLLGRKPTMAWVAREGEDVTDPAQAIFGPMVMIANQMSGSGGDALPWLFKKAKLGTLVGVRTWGGLVGISAYPTLMDGGRVTAPRWGLYGTEGKWEVENAGIAPDVEVEMDPALVRQGHDPQLERAVAIVMDELAKNPPKKLVRPAFPNYGGKLPTP